MPSTKGEAGGELAARLRAELGPAVDVSTRRRAEYSTDASNYRVVPQAVVFPRHTDDVLAAAAVCRELATPLTVRGGGTSIAGNSVGPGVVLDMSRHLNQVVSIDPEARSAIVQPGVVLDELQRAAGRYGLRFGPDPSTHARCTVGGMIGNNSCGAHAMSYGTTAANVVALDAPVFLHGGPLTRPEAFVDLVNRLPPRTSGRPVGFFGGSALDGPADDPAQALRHWRDRLGLPLENPA